MKVNPSKSDFMVREDARILVFVPMYNCAAQIGRVVAQFNTEIQRKFTKIIFVDNQSTDGSLETVKSAIGAINNVDVEVLRNKANYGLGGSHKVAFLHALKHGFDYIVVLHGDDQGSIVDLLPLLDQHLHQQADCLLGARFMSGSTLRGYSWFRTFGNHVFNIIYSIATGRRLFDLGSGLNLYAVDVLRDQDWLTFPDDLTFNYYLILASAAKRWRMQFFPIMWREEDQRSNVKMMRQALKVSAIVLSYVFHRRRFLTADWRTQPSQQYLTETIVSRSMVAEQNAGAARC